MQLSERMSRHLPRIINHRIPIEVYTRDAFIELSSRQRARKLTVTTIFPASGIGIEESPATLIARPASIASVLYKAKVPKGRSVVLRKRVWIEDLERVIQEDCATINDRVNFNA